MQFDARSAKALASGAHLTIDGCPGLRLVATDSRKTWTYRYKSPIDNRMRQVAIGRWPAMSATAAGTEWESLRAIRDAGRDPAQERRVNRTDKRAEPAPAPVMTVRHVVDAYLAAYAGTVAPKTYLELVRLFTAELDAVA